MAGYQVTVFNTDGMAEIAGKDLKDITLAFMPVRLSAA